MYCNLTLANADTEAAIKKTITKTYFTVAARGLGAPRKRKFHRSQIKMRLGAFDRSY